jgi:hypothetical protein
MNQRLLCIFHGSCDDGFGAAWAVRHAFNAHAEKLNDYTGIDFVPGIYAGKVPDVRGRHVLMVDFCYPMPIMGQMLDVCASMTVLDHHKSSMLDVLAWAEDQPEVLVASQNDGRLVGLTTSKAKLLFDMDRSGAMMAWDYYHVEDKPPRFIDYIQDHDLWTKKLDRIDEFTAGLRSYPMEFEVWDEFQHWSPFEQLLLEGTHILRYKRQLVDIAVKNSFEVKLQMPIPNPSNPESRGTMWRIRGANVPPAIASEVGEALALKYGGIGLTWVEGYKWIYSLRSRPVGDQPAVDVSLIAKAFDGGGHAQASGFKTTAPVHAKWLDNEDEEEG